MNTIIWTIFELIINCFQGFIFCFYSFKYLENGNLKTFIFSSGIVYSLILAIVISFFNYITIFEHFFALAYILIIFIYAMMKLNGTIIEKVFSSVLPILIMLVSAAFVSNFFSVLFNIPLEEILSQQKLPRLIAILTTQLMIIYFSMISLKILKKKEDKNSLKIREWILISFVLIISIVISAFLNFIALEDVSARGHLLIILTFLGIVFINITVCYLVADLSKMNDTIRENELLKLKHEYSQQYISSANSEYEVIRKLRHDFKDNWSVVYDLIMSNNNEKALLFMKDYLDELSEKEVFIKTNNEIVNAVVNAKLSAAKSYGINVICMCISDFSGISDLDLCSLLSNMLENAVTACKASQKEEKRIYINISADFYKFDFCVKNTIDDSVLTKNPELSTNKRNKSEHGIGIKIINSIAHKYNGKADFYEENDEFCCYVILKKN